jgi:hypothetical protein
MSGPNILFDKSFLQSLSIDESVLFDNFFNAVICPLFFAETLADLEKAVRQGRTPEQEVGIIADKVPELNSYSNVHHTSLGVANLMGQAIEMEGRVIIAGGRPVKVDGKSGIVHDQSPEAEAFIRWQKRSSCMLRVTSRKRGDKGLPQSTLSVWLPAISSNIPLLRKTPGLAGAS